MATFFSASGDQRDAGVGRDMPAFNHYSPSHHQYPEPSTVSLAPLPATAIAPEDEAARDDGRSGLAFTSAADEPTTTRSAAAISLQRQLMMMAGQAQANAPAMPHHGVLSLSLGTQVPASLYPYRSASADAALLLGGEQRLAGIAAQNSPYLNATRELLDEMVSVQDAIAKRNPDKNQSHVSGECKDADQEPAVESSPADLSPSERQELQNKVTALLSMLDEIDERYRRYQQQMQALASSLDTAAGRGAARPYTALARRTISRHFRSLRDAIAAQVQSGRLSLGEPADAPSPGIHRLRYIDQRLRQQRAAQQFGVLPPPAWRPQRGLPEFAVSLLRAWLFEHFLHPYPKDSEKLILARKTGLTRGQVSNWFINARVRLWKPMIEEMYKEEFGAEMESNSSSENGAGGKGKDEPVRSPEEPQSPSSAAAMHSVSQLGPFKSEVMAAAGTAIASLPDLDDSAPHSVASLGLHQRHDVDWRNSGDDGFGGVLLQNALAHHGWGGMRILDFGSGVAAGLGGYDGGNVSLTLGLHHRDGAGRVTMVTAGQEGLAPTARRDGVYAVASAGAFEYVDIPDDRQQIGSTSPLLHDFVT